MKETTQVRIILVIFALFSYALISIEFFFVPVITAFIFSYFWKISLIFTIICMVFIKLIFIQDMGFKFIIFCLTIGFIGSWFI
jgi:hypothetical protein